MFLKNKVRKNPEYQALLQKALRIKEICKGEAASDRSVMLLPIGTARFKPMHTFSAKKGHPDFDATQLEFFFRASIYDLIIEREIKEYLRLNAENCINSRDELGIKIMTKIFGNNYKELLALTHYDIVDIIFDFIDYEDDGRNETLLFHMRFYGAERFDRISKNSASKVAELLMDDVNNDNYGVLPSAPKKKTKEEALILVKVSNNRTIYCCVCGKNFAIPSEKKHVIAACPECKRKWDIRQ